MKTKTRYSSRSPIIIETTYYPPPWDLPTQHNDYYTHASPEPLISNSRSYSDSHKETRRSSLLSDIDFIQTLQTKLTPSKHDRSTSPKETDKRVTEELKAEVGRLRREKESEEWKKEVGKLRREIEEQKRIGEMDVAIGRARIEGEERVRELEREVESERMRAVEQEFVRERERRREVESEREKLRACEREYAREMEREKRDRQRERERDRDREEDRERMILLSGGAGGGDTGRISNPYMSTPRNNSDNFKWHVHVNAMPSSSNNSAGMESMTSANFESPFGRSETRRGGMADQDREMWNTAAGEVRMLGRRMTRMEDIQATMMETMERDRERHMEKVMTGRRYWN